MSAVEIRDWIDRSRELLARVAVTVEGAPSERVRLLADRLPASVTPDDGAVSVVFAGQYGAGKSSILKVLTGREDVAIGAGITTGEVCEYDWSGIRVVDTPGIHTELRPDHDAAAYEAVVAADLLVFVVSGTVLTIALQYKEDADAAKLERELREGRSSVRAGFGDAAEAVESHFDRVLGDCISRTIGRWLQEVDEQLADLREMQRTRGALFEALTRALADVQALIREMHSGSSHPA